MIRIYVTLMFILISGVIFAQEIKVKETKNAVIFDFANIVFTGNYALNLEHRIYVKDKIQSFISAGIGGWYSFNNRGQISLEYYAHGYSVPVTINTIRGIGNHHFEVDMGIRFLLNKSWSIFEDNGVVTPDPKFDYSDVKPVFNIGYRYHKINGKFIVRAFAGLGGLGVGIGKAF